jgi:hypothetical protein
MKRHRKRKRYGKKIFALAIIFLFLLLVAGIVLSPILKAKEINVYGNKEIDSEEIKNDIQSINILLMTSNGLKNKLLKNFPKISTVEIRKNILKRTIAVTITEREGLGIICKENTGNCFYVDKNGIIFEDAPQTSGSLVLLIKDSSLEEFSLGKKILEEQIITSIADFRENLFSQTNIKINWFEISTHPPKESKIITSEGWYLLLDLTRDTQKQLSILKTALDEKIKNRENLEYIDLRIENRIYYK